MIYVFKTSVSCRKDVLRVKPFLNALQQPTKWNFDLDDCDNILRIDGPADVVPAVINLLQEAGFDCEELVG